MKVCRAVPKGFGWAEIKCKNKSPRLRFEYGNFVDQPPKCSKNRLDSAELR